MLEIVYQDEFMVAINKPHGLLVHPSPLARDADTSAMQQLRDQLGQHVYPVHRIDRKTGGLLLFALDKAINQSMQAIFMERKVQRSYWAIVRGYTPEAGIIDYPLKKENGTMQEATTPFKTLLNTELPIQLGPHNTIRYSLIEAKPTTGRMHQIRKHFAHISHPVIGDRPHGCNKQNRFFKERWTMDTMMLHAASISFPHPKTEETIQIGAPIQSEFRRVMEIMQWETDTLLWQEA